MKLCFKILFCLYVLLSSEFLDASNDSLILDGNVHDDQFDGLLSDGSVTATEEDKDIRLSGYGQINLTLDEGKLELAVCQDQCSAKATVCYESVIGFSDPEAAGTCFESSCKVEIEDKKSAISFAGIPFIKKAFDGCITSVMKYLITTVVSSGTAVPVISCNPKIDGADKMAKLFVDIKQGCFVTVKNAKIHVPLTTTSPTKVPSQTQSSSKDSTEASSFPDWGYVVIGIVILIVILGIGFVAYYLYRKRQTSKRIPPNVDGRKSKSTVSKAKDAAEIPIKKDDDLEAANIESQKSQKKEKKNKTIERATAEDIPAPSAKQNLEPAKAEPKKIQKKEKLTTQEPTTAEDVPPPTPSKQLPPPNPAACYPLVKRLIPRGMKSAKTDSLDETLKKDKIAMVESFVVSAGKHCLKADESDVLGKMKESYPMNVQHVVLPSEVNLLCMPVSKMYEKMNTMAQISELKLAAAGCEFDDRGCMLSISNDARQLLKNKMTDATTVYLAFGAEFHEHISDKSVVLEEASIPLLYVIALQTRFSEKSRRRACATLRRKLVKVLGYFKAADRAKMPFPVNIVESAYCKDPKYFYDPTGIKTDSGSDEKKKQIGDGKIKKQK